jgi:hypothetical protein
MKKWQGLVFMIYAVMLLPAVTQANMLKNPGFEEGQYADDQSMPSYWECERSGDESWHCWKNDGQQHSGTKHIAVGGMDKSTWGYYKQNISDIKPGQAYIFTAWVATEGWQPPSSPAAYLRVEFKDSKGTILRTDKLAVVTGENTTWTYKTLITGVAPPGTTNADFMCYAQGKGTVWIDDVSVEAQSKGK